MVCCLFDTSADLLSVDRLTIVFIMGIFIIGKSAFILQQARIQSCHFSELLPKIQVYEDKYVHFK